LQVGETDLIAAGVHDAAVAFERSTGAPGRAGRARCDQPDG